MPNPFRTYSPPYTPSDNIKSIYRAMSQSNNPYAMFMQLAGNNPQMQPIINAMQQGNSPRAIFNNMCQQRGINPDEFIKNITG